MLEKTAGGFDSTACTYIAGWLILYASMENTTWDLKSTITM